jgi:lipoate-protein ligase A
MASSPFRLILDPPREAAQNMALDEVLSRAQSETGAFPSLRFYGWDSPAVTVGYFEDVAKAAKRFQAKKNQLAVVRRLTGGGAVLHGKDLTFSLCLRLPSAHFPTDVKSSYLRINEAIRAGLKPAYPAIDFADCRTALSVSASQKERVCFESLSCYDLLSGGKKILGASQRRIGRTMLHQSTLFLEDDPGKLAQRIIRGFRDLWKVEFVEQPLTPQEIRMAGDIQRKRYAAKDWAYLPGSFVREAIFFS